MTIFIFLCPQIKKEYSFLILKRKEFKSFELVRNNKKEEK